jgi:DNA-binding MarR family transcriptional regulator
VAGRVRKDVDGPSPRILRNGSCRAGSTTLVQNWAQPLNYCIYIVGVIYLPDVDVPPGDGSDCIGEVLDQAADLTVRCLTDRTGMSVAASFLLNRLNRGGPARLTALASQEGVSQPSMTQLIQRLERHDLVARHADPDDGRVVVVAITEAGQSLLDARTRIRRERLTALLSTLSSEETHALWLAAEVALPILRRVVVNADLSEGDHASQPDAAKVVR